VSDDGPDSSGPTGPDDRSGGVGRASLVLAAGTIVSRLLGFVSAVMLTSTIGAVGAGANTFALANQLPNNIYAIVAGGVLSAVLVPQIVRASVNTDGGASFINRLVTLGLVVFLAAAALATLAAPLLVSLYAAPFGTSDRGFSSDELALATAFAYWCLPQVLFYALYTLFGEVLNARRVFGPFTWAPAINNVVAIAGLVAFGALFDADVSTASAWTPEMIAVLGGSATLGVATQALVLVLFWRRAGLRYRPDFRWRGVGLGATGRAASWVFAMIVVMQIGGIVQTNVAAQAANENDASLMVMRTAWLLFMLPHSVVVVSLVTAYLTRMSAHARDRDLAAVRTDTIDSIRITALLMTLATVGLIAVAVPFGRIFAENAIDQIATVLIAFIIGLVPFSVYFVMQRVFYALDDTRTAFWLQAAHTAFFIVGALTCLLLPTAWIVIGIGIVTSLAGAFQMVLGGIVLGRRLGGLDARGTLRRMTQFIVAALPALAVGLAIGAALGIFGGPEGAPGFARDSVGGALITIAAVAVPMIGLYGGALLLMRVPDATHVVGLVRRRLGR
jgi:putative peptidoglycan lipid II flippase